MQPINTQRDPILVYQDLSAQADDMMIDLTETLESLENTRANIEKHNVQMRRITNELKNNWLNRLIRAICNFVNFIFSSIFMLISYLGKKLNFSKAEFKLADSRVAAVFDKQVKGKV